MLSQTIDEEQKQLLKTREDREVQMKTVPNLFKSGEFPLSFPASNVKLKKNVQFTVIPPLLRQ